MPLLIVVPELHELFLQLSVNLLKISRSDTTSLSLNDHFLQGLRKDLTPSKERLAKAAADWRASIAGGFDGTWFTQPPHETAWIPLPGDPQPSPMDHIPDDHDDWES